MKIIVQLNSHSFWEQFVRQQFHPHSVDLISYSDFIQLLTLPGLQAIMVVPHQRLQDFLPYSNQRLQIRSQRQQNKQAVLAYKINPQDCPSAVTPLALPNLSFLEGIYAQLFVGDQLADHVANLLKERDDIKVRSVQQPFLINVGLNSVPNSLKNHKVVNMSVAEVIKQEALLEKAGSQVKLRTKRKNFQHIRSMLSTCSSMKLIQAIGDIQIIVVGCTPSKQITRFLQQCYPDADVIVLQTLSQDLKEHFKQAYLTKVILGPKDLLPDIVKLIPKTGFHFMSEEGVYLKLMTLARTKLFYFNSNSQQLVQPSLTLIKECFNQQPTVVKNLGQIRFACLQHKQSSKVYCNSRDIGQANLILKDLEKLKQKQTFFYKLREQPQGFPQARRIESALEITTNSIILVSPRHQNQLKACRVFPWEKRLVTEKSQKLLVHFTQRQADGFQEQARNLAKSLDRIYVKTDSMSELREEVDYNQVEVVCQSYFSQRLKPFQSHVGLTIYQLKDLPFRGLFHINTEDKISFKKVIGNQIPSGHVAQTLVLAHPNLCKQTVHKLRTDGQIVHLYSPTSRSIRIADKHIRRKIPPKLSSTKQYRSFFICQRFSKEVMGNLFRSCWECGNARSLLHVPGVRDNSEREFFVRREQRAQLQSILKGFKNKNIIQIDKKIIEAEYYILKTTLSHSQLARVHRVFEGKKYILISSLQDLPSKPSALLILCRNQHADPRVPLGVRVLILDQDLLQSGQQIDLKEGVSESLVFINDQVQVCQPQVSLIEKSSKRGEFELKQLKIQGGFIKPFHTAEFLVVVALSLNFPLKLQARQNLIAVQTSDSGQIQTWLSYRIPVLLVCRQQQLDTLASLHSQLLQIYILSQESVGAKLALNTKIFGSVASIQSLQHLLSRKLITPFPKILKKSFKKKFNIQRAESSVRPYQSRLLHITKEQLSQGRQQLVLSQLQQIDLKLKQGKYVVGLHPYPQLFRQEMLSQGKLLGVWNNPSALLNSYSQEKHACYSQLSLYLLPSSWQFQSKMKQLSRSVYKGRLRVNCLEDSPFLNVLTLQMPALLIATEADLELVEKIQDKYSSFPICHSAVLETLNDDEITKLVMSLLREYPFPQLECLVESNRVRLEREVAVTLDREIALNLKIEKIGFEDMFKHKLIILKQSQLVHIILKNQDMQINIDTKFFLFTAYPFDFQALKDLCPLAAISNDLFALRQEIELFYCKYQPPSFRLPKELCLNYLPPVVFYKVDRKTTQQIARRLINYTACFTCYDSQAIGTFSPQILVIVESQRAKQVERRGLRTVRIECAGVVMGRLIQKEMIKALHSQVENF